MPAEMDEISRKVLQLEIEREALKKESDAASRTRLANLEEELTGKKEALNELKTQWEAEKSSVGKLTNDPAGDRKRQAANRTSRARSMI